MATLTVTLWQGSTQIATFDCDVVAELTDFEHELTTGERLAITDWSQLRYTLEAADDDIRVELQQLEYSEEETENFPPVVDAGADQHVHDLTSHVFTLAGSATDDGMPDPPGALTYLWTKVSGPGAVTFDDDTNPTTTFTVDAYGTYVLRLTADDSEATDSDDVTIELVEPVPARVSQLLAELLDRTSASIDVSQVLVEVMSPAAATTRVSQLLVEVLDASQRTVRLSQLVVEWLGISNLYCDEPDLGASILCGKIDVLAWFEWLVPARATGSPPTSVLARLVHSSVDLPDASTYYGGFKDARVLAFGTATRSLSDLTGQWTANDVTVRIADTDREIRDVLSTARVLRETSAVIRLISDEDRRAQMTPVTVFRGALRGWSPSGDLAVELEFTDAVGLRLARRGNDRQLPTRLVSGTDFPKAPSTSQALPIPIIYGKHEMYWGACPLIYVGPLDIGMGEMHTWVVAGHACVEIDLFLDDVQIIGEPPFGTSWFCPPGQGEPPFSGWTLPTPYVDINGRRYSLVQGTGADADAVADGSKTLTANVYGIETAGDGSGALIEQSFLQYLHFFQQFMLRDYQSGAWTTEPLLWEPGWCQINAQSFVDAQLESRRWVAGDGYVGAAYIGPDRRSVRDWLAVWNTSLNCRLGLNRYHQWKVVVLPGALDEDDLDALPRLSDALDVLRNSLQVEALDSEAITRATVRAYNIPKTKGVYGGSETYVDRQAETDAEMEIDASLQLDFLLMTPQFEGPLPTFLTDSAEDVAKRWIAFRSSGVIYRVTFRAGLCAYEAVDVGDLFRLTHFAGVSATGWTDRILWCESVALDVDSRTATFTALDVTHAYLGDRTLGTIVDPPDDEPPVIEGESPAAPSNLVATLIDAAEGSSRAGVAGTTVYYKLVALFDSGEEGKAAIVGPVTTGADADVISKRVNLVWDAYPSGAQTGRGGGSVLPTGFRLYRCPTETFLADVVQCDLTKYPTPEQPTNVSVSSRSGSGTTYYYWVRQFYYLSGVSDDLADLSVQSGATADVDVNWTPDPITLRVGRGTPPDYSDGVYVQQVFGRTASGGPGHAGRYLTVGMVDSYHDDGRDTEKGGGGIEPFPVPPTGSDLPLTATSFYDLWPGKADEADNPWVTT